MKEEDNTGHTCLSEKIVTECLKQKINENFAPKNCPIFPFKKYEVFR